MPRTRKNQPPSVSAESRKYRNYLSIHHYKEGPETPVSRTHTDPVSRAHRDPLAQRIGINRHSA